MPIVDVRSHLTDPTDAALATAEIDDLGADLQAAGGGTLFFSAGDYHLTGLGAPSSLGRLNPSSQIPDLALGKPFVEFDAYHQGGIRLRSGVSLLGESGTVLKWEGGNACVIGSEPPFDYVSTGPDPEDVQFVEGIITEPVVAGQTVFDVDDSAGFAAGDTVVIRLDLNPEDPAEVRWWSFASVVAVDTVNDRLTLDRPAQWPMVPSEQVASYQGTPTAWNISKVIRKVRSLVEGVSVKGFEIQLATPATYNSGNNTISGIVQAAIWLNFVRDVTVEDIRASDCGSGILVIQYGQNCRARNLHVKRSPMFGVQDETNTATYFGRGMSVAGGQGITVEDVRLENFQRYALLVEAASSQVMVRNLQIVNSSVFRVIQANDGSKFDRDLMAVTGRSEVRFDGLSIEGYGRFGLISHGTQSVRDNPVVINDLDIRTVPYEGTLASPTSFDPLAIDMRTIAGRVRIDKVNQGDRGEVFRQRFGAPRVWAKAILIPPDATTVVRLPDGLIKRGRLFLSSFTGELPDGLTSVRWPQYNGTAYELVRGDEGGLQANETIELPQFLAYGGAFGGSEQELDGGDPAPRLLTIEATDELAANQYLAVHLEYFPLQNLSPQLPPTVPPDPSPPFLPGSRDDHDGGWVQDPMSFAYPWVVRRDARVVGDESSDIALTSTSWANVFSGTSDLTVPAFAGQVLSFSVNFRVSQADRAASFDVLANTVDSMDLPDPWSRSDRGFMGWRVVGEGEGVSGSVTHVVLENEVDPDGNVVRLKLRYRSDGGTGSVRDLKVTGDDTAVVEVLNLGFRLEP